jgi:hypothetical protein
MMKPVLMVIEYATDSKTNEFDTVKEAQDYANGLSGGGEFQIYTLYTQGHRASIQWELQTDTGTNLRAVKQAKIERSGNWSLHEKNALKLAVKAGKSYSEIATALHRTYNSVYLKAKALE